MDVLKPHYGTVLMQHFDTMPALHYVTAWALFQRAAATGQACISLLCSTSSPAQSFFPQREKFDKIFDLRDQYLIFFKSIKNHMTIAHIWKSVIGLNCT